MPNWGFFFFNDEKKKKKKKPRIEPRATAAFVMLLETTSVDWNLFPHSTQKHHTSYNDNNFT